MKKKFRDFESARKFARSLNLKNVNEWQEYCKSGEKPDDIPNNAHIVYKKKWKGFGDWLGTGRVSNKDKPFLPFNESRKFARSLNLKSNKEWREYCKSGEKPHDIPFNPSGTYKNVGWIGLGDFLGTGSIAPQDRVYRSFEDARKFARSLNLKSNKEWREYCKSGNKPDDISASPHKTYKKDFKGFGDWLGTGRVANFNKQYRTYNEARKFAISLNLKSSIEWREYCKSGNKPDDISASPHKTYKKDFKGFGDWLGTGRTRDFRPFNEAREFTRSLNLKSQTEWQAYCASGNKPDDIPTTPNQVYKNVGWIGLGDWLGTGTVATFNKTYLSFTESREFVRSLGLKSTIEWSEYCKSGNKPDDIPAAIDRIYKNQFKDWGDFLGNGKTTSWKKFNEARKFAISLNLKSSREWSEYCKSGNKLVGLPNRPSSVYKKEWKNWDDFLGTGIIAPQNKVYRSFQEAREFVRGLKIKNHKEWKEYVESGNKPDDIPAQPWLVYSEWNIQRRAEKK